MKLKNEKGTPFGAPIPKQDYGTTPKAKSEAERLFDRINSERPIKRPKSPGVDRAFRQMIEHANRNGDCIINDGAGYYRPRRDDGFDEHCFHIYKAKELARARAIIDKLDMMEKSFYGRY